MVKVYAPASIGNVSVGFDVLGAAVSPIDGQLLGDCVTVEAAQNFNFTAKDALLANYLLMLSKILFINVGSYFVKN